MITNAKYVQKLVLNVGVILASKVASIVVAIFIALLLNGLGRTMSWYARPLWIFFLYVVPTTFVLMAGILFHAKASHKV